MSVKNGMYRTFYLIAQNGLTPLRFSGWMRGRWLKMQVDARVLLSGCVLFRILRRSGAVSRFNRMIAAQGNWPDVSCWRRWFRNHCRFPVFHADNP